MLSNPIGRDVEEVILKFSGISEVYTLSFADQRKPTLRLFSKDKTYLKGMAPSQCKDFLFGLIKDFENMMRDYIPIVFASREIVEDSSCCQCAQLEC